MRPLKWQPWPHIPTTAGVSGLIVSFQVYFEMMYIILIRHESSSSNIINMESGLPATRIKPNNKKLLGNWRDLKGRTAHAALRTYHARESMIFSYQPIVVFIAGFYGEQLLK